MAMPVLCHEPPPAIYRGIASFDECNDGLIFFDPFISVKFLDLWFYVSWSICETSLVVKNNLFAYTGDVQYLAKNRLPIPTGVFSAHKQRLVSDFKGRLARFRQIESSLNRIFLYFSSTFPSC